MRSDARYRHPYQPAPEGFTLIEVIIAMTLLGMVMVALYGGLRLGTRAFEAGEARAERTEELRVVEGFIRRQLSQAYPLLLHKEGRQQVVFKGDSQALEFAAMLPAHRGAGGLYVLSLRAADGPRGRQLLFSYRLARAEAIEPETSGEEKEPVALIESLASMDLSYYGPEEPDGALRWQPRWETTEALPQLVRLRIRTRDSPVQWPELMVPIRAQVHPGEPQLIMQTPASASAEGKQEGVPGGEELDERPSTPGTDRSKK